MANGAALGAGAGMLAGRALAGRLALLQGELLRLARGYLAQKL